MNKTTKYLPIPEAYEAVTGYRCHWATGLRWASVGRGGKVLSSWKINNRRMTTIEAVRCRVVSVTGGR